MVLAIAAELNLEVSQLDVKTAFLYADIEEEVYFKTAHGFCDEAGKESLRTLASKHPDGACDRCRVELRSKQT